MNHCTYLIILLTCLAGPLLTMIFLKQYRWTKDELFALLRVYVYVSLPFILADALWHALGWWSYNPNRILGLWLLGLPIEEITFFFVIPFCSLFLYNALIRLPILQRSTGIFAVVPAAVFCVIACMIAVNEPKQRTIIDALLAIGVVSAASWLLRRHVLRRAEVAWILLITMLFLLVNGLLTWLPVVMYDPAFGSQLRIGTIPLADGMYNASLLISALVVYRFNRYRRP